MDDVARRLCLCLCAVFTVVSGGVQTSGDVNSTDTPGIASILPFLQSPDFASKNISDLLHELPAIGSQNVSVLVEQFVPGGPSRQGVENLLKLVPDIASQNLSQLLQYFPQLAAQNVSQLLVTVSDILSNTTELEKVFGQIAGTVQKYTNDTGSQHGAFSSMQTMMNIPQLLSTGFRLTPASLYALSGLLKNNGVGQTCNDHIIATIVGLNYTQIWAMEMLDAMAKPPSYLRSFNFHWLRDYQECKDVDAITYSGKHFRGQYCSVSIPVPETLVKAIIPEVGVGIGELLL